MKRFLSVIIVASAVLMLSWGCFKTVVAYTIFRIAVYEQVEQNGEITKSEELLSYAYYVDTTEWAVLSYDDALAGRITNKTTGEVLSQPDVWGTFDSAAEFQTTLHLEQPISMLVVVDPELRLYAYRKYELPENLDQVLTRLTLSSWRASHAASGWQVENDFYTEAEEASADDITQN